MALVTKGDVILFTDMVRSATNQTLDPTLLTITWQQMRLPRSEAYVSCSYSVASSEKRGQLFIQSNKLQQLYEKRERTTDGPMIAVKVDDDFQYGQNEDLTDRFLVYHDKKNKPYQRRFVKQLAELIGDEALDWVRRMGFDNISALSRHIDALFGDYLKNFDK